MNELSDKLIDVECRLSLNSMTIGFDKQGDINSISRQINIENINTIRQKKTLNNVNFYDPMAIGFRPKEFRKQKRFTSRNIYLT